MSYVTSPFSKQDGRAIARKPRDAAAVRCGLKYANINYDFKSTQARKARWQGYTNTGAK